MPTMNDIEVDPKARSGKAISPVSNPMVDAASPHRSEAAKGVGAVKACPNILSGV